MSIAKGETARLDLPKAENECTDFSTLPFVPLPCQPNTYIRVIE